MRNWGRPNVRAQLGESRQLVCGPVSDLQHGLDSSIKFHPVSFPTTMEAGSVLLRSPAVPFCPLLLLITTCLAPGANFMALGTRDLPGTTSTQGPPIGALDKGLGQTGSVPANAKHDHPGQHDILERAIILAQAEVIMHCEPLGKPWHRNPALRLR